MLNHDDHRRLRKIERKLEREDPDLVQGMRQAWPRVRTWQFVSLFAVGAVLALLGLAVFSLYLMAVSGLCVVGGIVMMRKRRPRRVRPQSE